MGFFTVLATRADPEFSVHKLDVNLWLLPGLFGRTVTFCDIGIKLSVSTDVRPEDLGLVIGIPFRSDKRDPIDLISIIETNRTANLVFGNGAKAPVRAGGPEALSTYDDEDGAYSPVTLLPFDAARSRLCVSRESDTPYTTYTVAPRASLHPGRNYYLRLRFKVVDMGQVWLWQRAGARRAFAVADMRVNEFRDLPSLQEPPYWSGAVPLGRVNFFLVLTAKLKEQRRSPEPRYLRPLETGSWKDYLGRKLSARGKESFLIYYWRKENVTELTPFRAFLEVEKRRPTAAIYAWISSLATIAAFLLLWPSFDVTDTLLASLVKAGSTVFVAGGLALLTFAIRVAHLLLTHWSRLAPWVEKLEAKHFSFKK